MISELPPSHDDWFTIWQSACQEAVLRGLEVLRSREDIIRAHKPRHLRPEIAEQYVKLPDTYDLSKIDYGGLRYLKQREQCHATLADIAYYAEYYGRFERADLELIAIQPPRGFYGTFQDEAGEYRCAFCTQVLALQVSDSCEQQDPWFHCAMCGDCWCESCEHYFYQLSSGVCNHPVEAKCRIDNFSHQVLYPKCVRCPDRAYCVGARHLCERHIQEEGVQACPRVDLMSGSTSGSTSTDIERAVIYHGSIFDWVPVIIASNLIMYNANPESKKFGWYARGHQLGWSYREVTVEISYRYFPTILEAMRY